MQVIDIKPSGYALKNESTFIDQGYTYNQAGLTYNQSGVFYGGFTYLAQTFGNNNKLVIDTKPTIVSVSSS